MGGGGGGGGQSTKFYRGRIHPAVQPITSLFTIFDRKGALLVGIPIIDKCYPPCHIPSLERCIPCNCCKCTVYFFFIRTKHFFNNQIVFLGPLQTEMTHFLRLSYSSTSKISPEQGRSFWEELSHIGRYKEYPRSGTAEKFFDDEGCVGRNR